jgi:predicted phosphate transport protein (TIGR00153 family)
MLRKLLPRRTEFFDLFSQQATLLVEGARLLRTLVSDLSKAQEHVARIHTVEHEGDAVCQSIMEKLHRSFITPIDRGDIHRLASRLDDILDHIESTSQAIVLYDVRSQTPEIEGMAAHLVEASQAVKAAVDSLSDRMDADRTRRLCAAVKDVEKQNDRLLRSATARLFRDEHDARRLIAWKDIYADVESAVDGCEDVANLVEGVVLENA